MSEASRTTIITVAYNSSAVLERMFQSVPKGTPVTLVDNASEDQSADIARRYEHQVICLKSNQGFGRACNAGAEHAKTEFLFFVNPDAILGPGCIAALEKAADEVPQLTAANPQIKDKNGKPEFKTSSILRPKPSRMTRSVPTKRTSVPVLTGCAFFCRRSSFEAVHGFDPSIFLYHEDHDLAVRMDPGLDDHLWVIPEAEVQHIAGTSTPKVSANAAAKGYHMARSRFYVLKKHKRPLAFLRTLGPAVVGLIAPHNLLSPRRNAKFRGQIMGALSTLKDGGLYTSEGQAR